MNPGQAVSKRSRGVLASVLTISVAVVIAVLVWPTKSVVVARLWKDGYRVEVIGHPYSYIRDGLDLPWSTMDYLIVDHDSGTILGGGYLAGSSERLQKYKFGLLELSDTRFLCLVESSDPNSVIMIFDTRTGERWPGSAMDYPETAEEKKQRAELLFAAVQARTTAKLTLAGQNERKSKSTLFFFP